MAPLLLSPLLQVRSAAAEFDAFAAAAALVVEFVAELVAFALVDTDFDRPDSIAVAEPAADSTYSETEIFAAGKEQAVAVGFVVVALACIAVSAGVAGFAAESLLLEGFVAVVAVAYDVVAK